MSADIYLYQHINHLAYSGIPSATGNLPAPESLDEDASTAETAREFVRFELALPISTGAHEQLAEYALTQENVGRNAEEDITLANPEPARIFGKVRDELIEVNTKVRNAKAIDTSQSENMDKGVAEVAECIDDIVRSGIADESFREAVTPTSTDELVEVAERRSNLNELIAGWIRTMLSPFSWKATFDNTNSPTAQMLYQVLATQKCPAERHRALLRLSESSNQTDQTPTFQVYLYCANVTPDKANGHKTICRFERSSTASIPESPEKVCSRLQKASLRGIPLHLSFNDNTFWLTLNLPDGNQLDSSPVTTVSLRTILSQDHLRTADINGNIKKFRLAHRLALSLQLLCSSPWIQKIWDVESVRIITGESPIDTLDEAYVDCDVVDFIQTGTSSTLLWQCPGRNTCISVLPQGCRHKHSMEPCPRFLLSLAQVLVNLANGDTGQVPTDQDDRTQWYQLLVEEVNRKKNKDSLMKEFWSGVQGCLVYLSNLETQHTDIQDEKARAQRIIKDYIVDPLERNLEFWTEQGAVQNSIEEHDSHVPTTGSDRKGNLTERPVTRRVTEATFSLWSDEDDTYSIIPNRETVRETHSFVNYMKNFLSTYITQLRDTEEKEMTCPRVRVAIIDTGFHVDEDEDGTSDVDPDPFLIGTKPRIKGRKNFFSANDEKPRSEDWDDTHGHGTHVARLLLKWAPEADLYIAKITDSKSLRSTRINQLVEALKWAGDQADIINLSFSLGHVAQPEVEEVIERLVAEKTLIFAAASNTGGYGYRLWPASGPGVFGIHATDEFSKANERINPPAESEKDNFAIYGCNVQSFWKGDDVSISGTSFACPIAVAVTANILEFVRQKLPKKVAKNFGRYRVMSYLLRQLTENKGKGQYHCFRPWVKGFWDGVVVDTDEEHVQKICERLKAISIY